MPKVMYFDASSGVSGDMFVGALIDLGADFEKIKQDVVSLDLDIELRADKSDSYGIAATRFSVIDKTTGRDADSVHYNDRVHRHLSDIVAMIDESDMSQSVKNTAVSVFKIIGRAEAEAHGTDINSVHFHEVGALDSIADIVAASSAISGFDIDLYHGSPINTGSGTVRCRHGTLPVPAPAVLNILRGMRAYSDGTEAELATPTGTALLKHFCVGFGPMPEMRVTSSGCGVGSRDIGRPNIFRVILGEQE